MAEIGGWSIRCRLVPDDETMEVILKLLNLWQDDNPERMVAMVPGKDRYVYEIIDSGRKASDAGDGLERAGADGRGD